MSRKSGNRFSDKDMRKAKESRAVYAPVGPETATEGLAFRARSRGQPLREGSADLFERGVHPRECSMQLAAETRNSRDDRNRHGSHDQPVRDRRRTAFVP